MGAGGVRDGSPTSSQNRCHKAPFFINQNKIMLENSKLASLRDKHIAEALAAEQAEALKEKELAKATPEKVEHKKKKKK